LSESSVSLLEQLTAPVQISVFISPDNPLKPRVQDLLSRYETHTDQLTIRYIDPSFAPELVREYAIQRQAEMVVQRGEMNQHVYDVSEQSLSNALLSVSRQQEQWLVFIEGHTERSLFEQNDFSLSTWASQLKSKGFKLHSQNLVIQPQLPDNTQVVVIASPLSDWLPAEIAIIRSYVENGGNLLWLADPEQTKTLIPLAESLGLHLLPGTVMDPNALDLGLQDPRFALVSDYANHPVTQDLSNVSLLAAATAIEPLGAENDWTRVNLLNSQETTWVETNPLNANNLLLQTVDDADIRGPVSLGYALSRDQDSHEQRVAVIGDSDFATNNYIGNLANLDLAMSLVNWLVEDDNLISIPIKTSADSQLILSPSLVMLIGLGFLLGVPLLLFITGMLIWWRRRRR
jgi:ABC-type uncharacterized transport system involved in gliding motility auxiliary subunit